MQLCERAQLLLAFRQQPLLFAKCKMSLRKLPEGCCASTGSWSSAVAAGSEGGLQGLELVQKGNASELKPPIGRDAARRAPVYEPCLCLGVFLRPAA